MLEMLVKILGSGLPGHFSTRDNQFDCFITFASGVDTAVTLAYGIAVAPECQALGFLRALRVFRLVKLLVNIPGTAVFIDALDKCLEKLWSVIVLWCASFSTC